MNKLTKKQRVEQYLNRLMKGRYFKIDDLMSLTVSDLKENTSIMDIGRSTISDVLKKYKSQYEPKSPVKSDTVNQEYQQNNGLNRYSLTVDEIEKLRNIIDWFEDFAKIRMKEMDELISALNEMGINYRQIIKQYRKLKKTEHS